MRISDWSSDVCSSDLPPHTALAFLVGVRILGSSLFSSSHHPHGSVKICVFTQIHGRCAVHGIYHGCAPWGACILRRPERGSASMLLRGGDRKSTRLNSSH